MRSRQGSGASGGPGEPSQIYVRATGRRRHRGRRLLLALLVLLVVGAAVWLALAEGRAKPVAQPGEVRLLQGKRVVLRRFADELRGSTPRQLSDWLRRIPDRRVGRLGAGRATYQTDRSALAQLVRTAIRSGGDDVPVPERAIAFRSQIPIVKQALRNNCETAALSVVAEGVAGVAHEADHLALAYRGPVRGAEAGLVRIAGRQAAAVLDAGVEAVSALGSGQDHASRVRGPDGRTAGGGDVQAGMHFDRRVAQT